MERENYHTNTKITTSNESSIQDKIKSDKPIRDIMVGPGLMVHKEANEPPSSVNPDNGAFFEERSNPLSSKGN